MATQIDQSAAPQSDYPDGAAEAASNGPVKRTLAPGFKRNMLIIGGVFILAAAVIVFTVLGAKSGLDGAKNKPPVSVIPSGELNTSTPTDLTPSEKDRLSRVQKNEADAAKKDGATYIPKDLSVKAEEVPGLGLGGPGNGPGQGYIYMQGDRGGGVNTGGGGAPVGDQQREAAVRRGLDLQLASIFSRMEPPSTQRADIYRAPSAGGDGQAPVQAVPVSLPTGSVAAGAATSSAAMAVADVLVRGLQITGARLVSPLDTSKSDFISAEIDAGPLAGAYLIGKGRMVGEQGVQLSFQKMSFAGETYAISATGLDSQTSSEAMSASVDRRLLARYVMPVVFTTMQAYLTAAARPAQTAVVSGGAAATQIVSPAASAREAIAAGLAAGVGKATEGLSQARATAFLPVDTPIALLFVEPVSKKASK